MIGKEKAALKSNGSQNLEDKDTIKYFIPKLLSNNNSEQNYEKDWTFNGQLNDEQLKAVKAEGYALVIA